MPLGFFKNIISFTTSQNNRVTSGPVSGWHCDVFPRSTNSSGEEQVFSQLQVWVLNFLLSVRIMSRWKYRRGTDLQRDKVTRSVVYLSQRVTKNDFCSWNKTKGWRSTSSFILANQVLLSSLSRMFQACWLFQLYKRPHILYLPLPFGHSREHNGKMFHLIRINEVIRGTRLSLSYLQPQPSPNVRNCIRWLLLTSTHSTAASPLPV